MPWSVFEAFVSFSVIFYKIFMQFSAKNQSFFADFDTNMCYTVFAAFKED